MTHIRSKKFNMMVRPFSQRMRAKGFTIIELLIAILVGSIVMAGVMTAFLSQHKSYIVQDDVVEIQQNVRVSMDLIARDIRSAGYDPNSLGAGITVAGLNSLSFTRDDLLNPNTLETITYSLYDAFTATIPPANDGLLDDLARQVTDSGGGTAGRQPVVENISQLEFRYLDISGTVTAVLADIRSIEVTILAVARLPDANFTNTMTYTSPSGNTWGSPYGDNLRRRMFTTTIKCRNL